MNIYTNKIIRKNLNDLPDIKFWQESQARNNVGGIVDVDVVWVKKQSPAMWVDLHELGWSDEEIEDTYSLKVKVSESGYGSGKTVVYIKLNNEWFLA